MHTHSRKQVHDGKSDFLYWMEQPDSYREQPALVFREHAEQLGYSVAGLYAQGQKPVTYLIDLFVIVDVLL